MHSYPYRPRAAGLHGSQLAWVLLLSSLVYACGLSIPNIQSKQAADLEVRRIKRIAVLPPAAPAAEPAKNKLLGVPTQRAPAPAAHDAKLMGIVQATLSARPTWQIVSDKEVQEVTGGAPGSDLARARRIGSQVYADAVLIGSVTRFRERVGDEWGAKTPASVAFSLELVDVKKGDVVWSARFDETQKGLSENLLALGDIGQRGIRWLSGEQLLQDGVRKAIDQLHRALVGAPAA